MELINLHAFQVLKLLNNNEITSEDYVTELLKHINKREPLIGAWNYLNEDLILNSAKKLDEKRKISTGENTFGLPIGIKDIIDTYDMPTENGSKICIGRQPSKDAHLVKLLRKEGLIIFGKTVTTEFALSAPGKTKNPKDLECTPGGSSSGSAAAVGDNMIPLSIGSQTGGSVLRPASFNGIIGFKPTFGTISRTGMSPVSFRLDHPGIYARCIEDIELIASIILSYDENDYDMIKDYHFQNHSISNLKDFKFAFVKGPAWKYGDEDMKKTFENFIKSINLRIDQIQLPSVFEKAVDSHITIMNGGIRSSLYKHYNENKLKLHPYTIERIENGSSLSASDYIDAIQNAKKMSLELKNVFSKYDAIITPAATGQAPRDLSTTGNAVFNGYWTMLGVPAISLPLLKGKDDLPIGAQVIAPWKEDNKLLSISKAIMNL